MNLYSLSRTLTVCSVSRGKPFSNTTVAFEPLPVTDFTTFPAKVISSALRAAKPLPVNSKVFSLVALTMCFLL